MELSSNLGLGVILSMRNLLSDEAKKAERDLKTFSKTADAVNQRLIEKGKLAADAMDKYRAGAMRAAGVGAVGAAMAAPLVIFTKKAIESEKRMSSIRASLVGTGVSGRDAAKQVQQLDDAIKSLTMKGTLFDNDVLEQGARNLFEVLGGKTGLSVLENTLHLSEATGTSFVETTALMSSMMNTFGRKMGPAISDQEKSLRIANILNQTIDKTGMSAEELSLAFSRSAANAAATNISLESQAAMLVTLKRSGVERRTLGMDLAGWLESVATFKLRMREYNGFFNGVSVTDKNGMALPLAQVLKQLEDRLHYTPEKGVTTFAQSEISKLFPGPAGNFIIGMLGQSKALEANAEAMKDSTSLQNSYNEVMHDAWAGIEMAKNKLNISFEDLGAAMIPAVKNFADFANVALPIITDWIKKHPDLATGLVGGYALASGAATVGGASMGAYYTGKMGKAAYDMFRGKGAAKLVEKVGEEAARYAANEGAIDAATGVPVGIFSKTASAAAVAAGRGRFIGRMLPRVLGPVGIAAQILFDPTELGEEKRPPAGMEFNPPPDSTLGSVRTDHSYNPTTINVFPSPGMSEEGLARKVADLNRKRADRFAPKGKY